MSENVRRTAFGVGLVAQADLVTANINADLIRFTSLNAERGALKLSTEDDAADIGKDDEFASNVYPLAWDFRKTLEMQLTSENLAWALAYGLGTSTVTNPVALTYRHTCAPQTSGIDLIPFSYVEKLPLDGSLDDYVAIGCVIESITVELNSGPGRNNAKLIVEIIGTGKRTRPSTLTLPAVGTLHNLNAASAAATILGTNYVTAKSLLSMRFGFRNNLRADSGYFIGSGVQSLGAIRGRMEHGDREAFLEATVRQESSPDEQAQLEAATTGTAVITLQGAIITGSTHHDASFTFQKVQVKDVTPSDADGIAARTVVYSVIKHASNGLLTAYATNAIPLVADE